MKTFQIFALFGLLAFGTCATLNSALLEKWDNFKATHSKVYNSVAHEMNRLKIFAENLEFIAEHNKLFEQGKKSFAMKMNFFGDLKLHEFAEMMNTYRHQNNSKLSLTFQDTNVAMPTEVDWREKNLVTPVKNQADCGSCWAFSTTGTVEGQHAKKTGQLVSLSEQNLIDCAGYRYGNLGCRGGLPSSTYAYIISNGIDTESSYPYIARKSYCQFDSDDVGATISDFVAVSPTESALQSAVATVGPISIAIDASHRSMQFYSYGVYDEPNCSADALDHAVLAVGYGVDEDSGKDYWLVKNSWASSWGMEGYIMMTRNDDNQCGIASAATYPLI